jgi:hypothetical protein
MLVLYDVVPRFYIAALRRSIDQKRVDPLLGETVVTETILFRGDRATDRNIIVTLSGIM